MILCSCRNVEITRDGDYVFPPSDPQKVKVLYSAPAAVNYIPIADIAANGSSERLMCKEAAKLGADAVIVKKIGVETSAAKHRILGTAIKYQ
jgi:hypothetical protein